MHFRRTTILIVLLALAASRCHAAETMDERLARLKTMSASDKETLRRNHERLEKLAPPEQQQLRNLEQELVGDPKGEQLRQVILRYHKWLRALPSADRATLLSLSEEERIPKIKSMIQQQETDRLREQAMEALTREDADQVRTWMGNLTVARKNLLLAQLPQPVQEKLADSREPRHISMEFFKHFKDRDRNKPPPILDILQVTEDDRQALVSKLSQKARDMYAEASSEPAKLALIQNWIAASFRPRLPSPEELKEFLTTLSSEERDRLENLPPEQMKDQLIRGYFKRRFEKERQGHMGHGGRPPGPPNRGPQPREN